MSPVPTPAAVKPGLTAHPLLGARLRMRCECSLLCPASAHCCVLPVLTAHPFKPLPSDASLPTGGESQKVPTAEVSVPSARVKRATGYLEPRQGYRAPKCVEGGKVPAAAVGENGSAIPPHSIRYVSTGHRIEKA
eukprot:1769681-Rhodomonas_salina.1